MFVERNVLSERKIEFRGSGARVFAVKNQEHQFFGARVIILHELDDNCVVIAKDHNHEHTIVVTRDELVPCRFGDQTIGIARALGRDISQNR